MHEVKFHAKENTYKFALIGISLAITCDTSTEFGAHLSGGVLCCPPGLPGGWSGLPARAALEHCGGFTSSHRSRSWPGRISDSGQSTLRQIRASLLAAIDVWRKPNFERRSLLQVVSSVSKQDTISSSTKHDPGLACFSGVLQMPPT